MTTDQMVAILGVLVAVLGVLFTAGAIVAAVLIFHQSRDYRARLNEARETLRSAAAQYQEQIATYIAEKNAELQAVRTAPVTIAPGKSLKRDLDNSVAIDRGVLCQ